MSSNALLQRVSWLSVLLSSMASAQSIESGLVSVPAIVTDKEYKEDSGPVSAVIVLDASSNMKSLLAQSQVALLGFFSLARPGDEYALIVSQGHKKSRVEVPFTSDQDRIRKGFSNVTPGGAAPLFDSIEAALDLAKKGKNERRVILAMTDGFDRGSDTKFKKLRSDVLESNASLYGLEVFASQAHEDIDEDTLKELVELSGGGTYR